MNHREKVDQIYNLYKANEWQYKIDNYLKAFNLSDEETQTIKKEAKVLYRDYVIEKIQKRNKIIFWISIPIFIISIYLFYFYFPSQNIVEGVWFHAIFGAFFICMSAFCIYSFSKKSKKEEFGENPKLEFDLGTFFSISGILVLIPTIILAFMIAWRFDKKAKEILAETKVQTKGVIVSGTYYESVGLRKRPDNAEITVKYKTKNKKTYSKTVSVSPGAFNSFYKGQVVDLIYSSENPMNMQLLTDSQVLKEIFKTEERPIMPKDLLSFLDLNDKEFEEKLKKISYGWKFNTKNNAWVNERQNYMISKIGDEIAFIVTQNDVFILDQLILKEGFTKNNIPEEGSTSFENEKYHIGKMFMSQENQNFTIYLISKK